MPADAGVGVEPIPTTVNKRGLLFQVLSMLVLFSLFLLLLLVLFLSYPHTASFLSFPTLSLTNSLTPPPPCEELCCQHTSVSFTLSHTQDSIYKSLVEPNKVFTAAGQWWQGKRHREKERLIEWEGGEEDGNTAYGGKGGRERAGK